MKIMDSIPKYIKIEEDELFIQGIETESNRKNRQFVINLITGTDFSNEKIANLASVKIEFVEQIRKEI
jgi:hypothetical protein